MESPLRTISRTLITSNKYFYLSKTQKKLIIRIKKPDHKSTN